MTSLQSPLPAFLVRERFLMQSCTMCKTCSISDERAQSPGHGVRSVDQSFHHCHDIMLNHISPHGKDFSSDGSLSCLLLRYWIKARPLKASLQQCEPMTTLGIVLMREQTTNVCVTADG